MKNEVRSFFALTSGDIDQLEDKLIQKDSVQILQSSIRQMEELFIQSKVLDSLLKEEQATKAALKENVLVAQRRMSQIAQLQQVVKKRSSLIKVETTKITEALTLNKILLMQRLVRMQRQTQEMQRKRQTCQRIKNEMKLQEEIKNFKASEKLQRIRLQSLGNTINIRNQLHEVRCNTMQMKRKQAQEIKLAHQRQRSKSKNIQIYKRLRAQNNYLSKISQIKQEIDRKQEALQILCRTQNQQEIKVGSTIKVTEQYLHTFFPTQHLAT